MVVALCSFAVALVLAVGVTPAGAVVTELGGHGYGITPISGADQSSLVGAYLARHPATGDSARARHFDEPPFGGAELQNLGGGPVMHQATTHVIYWDPSSQFTTTTKGIVSSFFGDVAAESGLATNVFAIAGQYTDSIGHAAYSSTFAGTLVDSHAYPTTGNCTVPNEVDKGPYETCVFDKQLREELVSFIAERGLPTGSTQLYFVLLPHKVATCMEEVISGKQVCSNNFYCAYHSSISPGTPSEVIYADIPFSLLDTGFAKGCQADGNEELQLPNGDRGASNTQTRFADIALKYVSHEYIEAVTDPRVGFDTAWVDEEGLEIGDKCNGVPFEPAQEGQPGFDFHAFTPTLGGSALAGSLFNQSIDGGSFYLQSEWDNAGSACLMKPLALGAGEFAPPSPTAGSPAAFTGGAPDPYEGLEPTWSFGDGGSGAGVSVSHTYATAGAYTVTMTPRDRLTGSTGTPVTQTVTVAPALVGGGGGSAGGTTSGGGGGGGGGGVTPPAPVTTPIAPVPANTAVAVPHDGFSTATEAVNSKTGVVTLTTSVLDPGTLTFVATFPNGKLGAFVSAAKCKRGEVKLGGRCLPSTIVFAKGSKSVPAGGRTSVTLKPTVSAMRALKNALRQRRGVPVSIVLSFQSSLGGAAVSHTQTVIVKPRR